MDVTSQSAIPLHYTERLYRALMAASRHVGDLLYYYGTPNGKGDYLDLSTDGRISWRPFNRPSLDPYEVKGRMVGKPAKAVMSFLPDTIDKDPNQFELFATKFNAQQEAMNNPKLELVKGKDILKYYDSDSYTQEVYIPALSQSCMRYKRCAPWLKLYSENPRTIQMLVQFDTEGKLIARALVWQTQKHLFMDRVYGSDLSRETFRHFATKQGWLYRAYNGYEYPNKVISNGKEVTRNLAVELDNLPNEGVPYTDTFLWLSRDLGKVANSKVPLKGAVLLEKLRLTDGRAEIVAPRAGRVN